MDRVEGLRRFVNAHRMAIVVLLLAFSLLLNALALKVAIHASARATRVSNGLSHEQRATAAQAHSQCVRSRIFSPPLIDHIELVERRLHVGPLERKVEWPIGSKKKVDILKFYRQTIPKSCPLSRR